MASDGAPWSLERVERGSQEFNEVAGFIAKRRNPCISIYPNWYSWRHYNVGDVKVQSILKFKSTGTPGTWFERNPRNAMESMGSSDVPAAGRTWLFHGTKRSAQEIAEDGQGGLDPRFAANGFIASRFQKFYGSGLYLADSLDYSHQFARPIRGCGAAGQTAVIICDVFIGKCKDFKADRDRTLVRPPDGFDSVKGDVCQTPWEVHHDSKMFVVYEKSYIRPLYEVVYSFEAVSSHLWSVKHQLEQSGMTFENVQPLLHLDAVPRCIAEGKNLAKDVFLERWANATMQVLPAPPSIAWAASQSYLAAAQSSSRPSAHTDPIQLGAIVVAIFVGLRSIVHLLSKRR